MRAVIGVLLMPSSESTSVPFGFARMIEIAAEWLSSNAQEAATKRLLRVIVDAGGELSGTELAEKTQWLKKRGRNEIIESLVEANQLAIAEIATGGRAIRAWLLLSRNRIS